MNLSCFFDYWLSVVSPNIEFTTLYGYKNIVNNHIKLQLGDLEIETIKPYDLHNYYNIKLSEGLSSNTVRKHHDLLKMAFKLAIFEMIISINPAERVIPPKKKNSAIRYYDAETLNKLLKCAMYDKLRLVIYLCAFLGLRRGEVCGLTWKDVDFNNHTLEINKSMVTGGRETRIKEPKNKTSFRTLYIPNALEKFLYLEYQRQDNIRRLNKNYNCKGFVIVGTSGHPHHPNYLSYEFTKFIKDNDLPLLTLHGLRHTFATVANQAGVSLFDISKALGHSTPSVTGRIYTHITGDTYKKAISAVSEMIDLNYS